MASVDQNTSSLNVAVVIPLFNGARWIAEALESVFSQESPPAEVVVVDDGSTDGSQEQVLKFPQARLLHNGRRGPVLARKLGIAETRSPLVAFLDHDDLWHPGHLRILVQTLARYPDTMMVVSGNRRFWEETPPLAAHPVLESLIDEWERFPFVTLVGTPSAVLLRRWALYRVGGWEEEYTGIGDMLLWLKLCCYWPIVHLQAPTVAYRQHAGSQKRLVRKDPLVSLDLRVRMAGRALAFRRESGKPSIKLGDYERRLITLKLLRELAFYLIEQSDDAFAKTARRLHESLSPESSDFLRSVFLAFLSAMSALYDDPRTVDRSRPLRLLLDKWPTGLDRTRRVIYEVAEVVDQYTV